MKTEFGQIFHFLKTFVSFVIAIRQHSILTFKIVQFLPDHIIRLHIFFIMLSLEIVLTNALSFNSSSIQCNKKLNGLKYIISEKIVMSTS